MMAKNKNIVIIGGIISLAILFRGRIMPINRMKGETWDMLTPYMKTKTLQILGRARSTGLDVMFFEGWRDPKKTLKNIKAGTTKIKDAYGSRHTWGEAIDIVFRHPITGAPYWPDAKDKQWQQLGAIGKSLGLSWGGDFKSFFDGPHFYRPVSVYALKKKYTGNNYKQYISEQSRMA